MGLDADWQVSNQLGQAGIHPLAQFDNVDAGLVGDGERDRRLSVKAHQGERRIAVANLHLGEVTNPDKVSLRAVRCQSSG